MAAGRIVITLILIASFAAVASWTVVEKICVDDCSGRTLGYFQSCDGCGVFVACVWGKLYTFKCSRNNVWDDYWKACQRSSQTCPQVEQKAAIVPGGYNSAHAEIGSQRFFGAILSFLNPAAGLALKILGSRSKPTRAPAPPPRHYPDPTWPMHPPTTPPPAMPTYPPTTPPPAMPTYPPTTPPDTGLGTIVCNGEEGSRCVHSCVQDGNHQSCYGCNMYVTCNGGIKYDKRPCAATLVWDDNVKACVYHSTTCKQC
ncbi:hypothetical protein LSAT2_025039 [Lamellibrachia satsuma]|nr:hypothetical protein LSAT2_025039 [Lamellibrachia satsuma]